MFLWSGGQQHPLAAKTGNMHNQVRLHPSIPLGARGATCKADMLLTTRDKVLVL